MPDSAAVVRDLLLFPLQSPVPSSVSICSGVKHVIKDTSRE